MSPNIDKYPLGIKLPLVENRRTRGYNWRHHQDNWGHKNVLEISQIFSSDYTIIHNTQVFLKLAMSPCSLLKAFLCLRLDLVTHPMCYPVYKLMVLRPGLGMNSNHL